VELSAIYHDVVKDRLYTDAANSHRRRATQTVLYRMVTGLCKMLAPILVFTADEAWGYVPAAGAESVHETQWTPSPFTLSDAENALWTQLLALRSRALLDLEQARQAKTIGKALEAKLRFIGPRSELAAMTGHEEELRELLNVSALSIEFTDDAKTSVALARADGQKCERCWHWESDVGTNVEHPTICGRCMEAIAVNRNG
jgi:isoleucyl-tRNA synthetase